MSLGCHLTSSLGLPSFWLNYELPRILLPEFTRTVCLWEVHFLVFPHTHKRTYLFWPISVKQGCGIKGFLPTSVIPSRIPEQSLGFRPFRCITDSWIPFPTALQSSDPWPGRVFGVQLKLVSGFLGLPRFLCSVFHWLKHFFTVLGMFLVFVFCF